VGLVKTCRGRAATSPEIPNETVAGLFVIERQESRLVPLADHEVHFLLEPPPVPLRQGRRLNQSQGDE